MKNITKGLSKHWSFDGPFACDSDKIWVLVSPILVQELSAEGSCERDLEIEIDVEDLIRMDYLQLEDKLFFITKTSLVSHSLDSGTSINEGEMGVEILDARWAPSQELIVIVLANGNVSLHGADLEVLKTFQLPETIPSTAHISWRSDSKFIQICSSSPSGYLVHNFDNKLDYTANTLASDTKGPVLSLGDNAKLLNSSQISWHYSQIAGFNCNKVIFWERNCLKHEDFQVLGTQITKLDWGLEGKVLSVLTNAGLEIYCKFNYHWYLKSVLSNVKDFIWQDDFVVYTSEGITKQRFYFEYNENNGKVAVIDGFKVNLTDFNEGIMPPPMSHLTLVSDEPVLQVSLWRDKVLALTESKVMEMKENLTVLRKKVDKVLIVDGKVWFAVGKKVFYIEDDLEVLAQEFENEVSLLWTERGFVGVQTNDGKVFWDLKVLGTVGKCADLVRVRENGEVYLLKGGNLFVGDKVFASNCTSFYYSGEFLFFVRKNAPYDILYIFHDSDLPWTKPLPEPSNEHFYSRFVEKTSSIVALTQSSLVLEHSRGNLETIAPRRLVLHQAHKLVKNQKYLEGFKLLRQHKIDLNLLYDIDPMNFDVKSFVGQIKRQDFINLFLTSLKDVDSTCKYFLKESQDVPGKTNELADKIREFLDSKSQILSVLTSYVVKSPPELEIALNWVQSIISKEPKKLIKPPHEHESIPHSTSEDALKYLSWLVNPDKLYNVALSMYDLQLASTLAKYTQKDPKEYLPYLNSLHEIAEVERKYQICMDLKNYPKALEELVKGGQDYRSKAIDLIKSHKLYLKGLQILPGPDTYSQIAQALSSSEFAFQSAVLYELCGEYAKAMELYSKSEEWDLACRMNDLVGLEHTKETWSSKCAELGRFEHAAVLTPASQELTKIRYWISAGKYKQAATAACGIEGKDLVRSTLKHYASDFCELLDKNLKIFNEKKARLDHVQSNKKLMPNEEKVLNDEVASQYSLNSLSSKATQVSKRQRKNNKKIRKTAAKEGNVFEEDYLVDLLVSLRPDNSYFEKVEGLVCGLVICGDFATARMVWNKFDEIRKVTFQPLATLRQLEFLKKFYEDFPEISKSEDNDSRLKDMFSKSQFLAEGLASHKLPVFQPGVAIRFFMSFT